MSHPMDRYIKSGLMQYKEPEYDEMDFKLTLKTQSGKDIPKSEMVHYIMEIEKKMSNDKFLVVITDLDPEEYEVTE